MTPVGALCRNSEIYNHEAIKEQGALKGVRITKDSKSDSAIIGHLYQKLGDGPELWNMLDGVFACVLYDEETNEYIAARSVVCGASVHTCCAAATPASRLLTAASSSDLNTAHVALRHLYVHMAACRDPLGICPLYWGKGRDGSTWFSSEMKALQSCCTSFEIFPPVSPCCTNVCGRKSDLHTLVAACKKSTWADTDKDMTAA